jgi:TolB-like protein
MPEDRVDRRLAAILAADVAGYSRLMEANEEGTLRQLKTHRKDLIDPKIVEHRGRIVKTTGDGMLVEFVSVVDAVRCAVEIQRSMAERNNGIAADQRIEFRIGINIGDIIIDGGDIFGDGVNVAARVETLADPGGIMVSGIVHEQVRDKLDFRFDDLGEQAVKNIARPIGVHRIQFNQTASVAAKSHVATHTPTAAVERPSIAVLPFTNMSGDSEQEYFADGISEDLITGLSKLRWFFVIARNSSFAYKGQSIDVKRAARELGVRYVLEGSVRKGGNRVRITTQLVDAITGNHIWADRYDGELTDIFALQDEITRKVVAAIEPKLLEAEALRSKSRSAEDLDAWQMVMHANSLFWRMTESESKEAIDVLERAIERYPNYAPAYSMLAFMLLVSSHLNVTPSMPHGVARAPELGTRAAELDDGDPWAHLALGYVAFMQRRMSESISEFQRALQLNPNFAAAHGYLGWTLAFDGQSEEALTHLHEALRMSPHDPQNAIFNVGVAISHYMAERYDDAIAACRIAFQQRAGMARGTRIYIASLAQSGRIEEAQAALARMKQTHADLSIAWIEQNVPYMPSTMAKFLEGMRKAGLQ